MRKWWKRQRTTPVVVRWLADGTWKVQVLWPGDSITIHATDGFTGVIRDIVTVET